MAYIFGRVTKKEAAKLRAAGWKLEEPERVLEEMADTAKTGDGEAMLCRRALPVCSRP